MNTVKNPFKSLQMLGTTLNKSAYTVVQEHGFDLIILLIS